MGNSAGPDMSLSAKQQAFVAAYLELKNATQAAIRAGYSKKSAEVTGHRLLRNAKVADLIATAQAESSKRTGVNLDYVLRRLAIEAEREGEGASHSARVSALGHLRQHFEAAGADDDDAPRMRFDIHVNAPVKDVRVTKAE